MKKPPAILFRTTEQLKKAVERAAKKDNRSVNNWLNVILQSLLNKGGEND